jgi:hypothetical protein
MTVCRRLLLIGLIVLVMVFCYVSYRVPGVNNLYTYGHWDFTEFTKVYMIGAYFEAKVEDELNKMVEGVV